MRRPMLALALVSACGPEAVVEDADEVVPLGGTATRTLVAHQLRFAEVVEGVSAGFDLDQQGEVCGLPDFSDPGGAPGIDNSLAGLLPLIAAVGGEAFESLIQAAVDSGEFLLVLETVPGDDGCTAVTVSRAGGDPLLGADGALLPYQTFAVRDDVPPVADDCAAWEDEDTVVATGLTLPLQIQIFQFPIDLELEGTSFRIHFEEDGTGHGVAAGGVSTEALWAEIGPIGGIGTELLGILEGVLDIRADLAWGEDGSCTHMSAVMEFGGIPAFVSDQAVAGAGPGDSGETGAP